MTKTNPSRRDSCQSSPSPASNVGGPGCADPLADQLRQFLALIQADGGLREVRVLDVMRTKYPHKVAHTESGYFKPEDRESLERVAAHFRGEQEAKVLPGDLGLLNGRPKGAYYTLNPVKDAAYARSPAVVGAGRDVASAADKDIEHRTRLLIDIDAPREVSNVAASEAEKAVARQLFEEVGAFLREQGWPEPIQIDSGNGYQLIFAIDLPPDDGGLVQRALQALAAKFPRPDAGIDTAVHNPARIARLPGTWNCKGHDIDERPHRLAKVLSLPDSLEVVTDAQLESVAAMAGDATKSSGEEGRRSSTKEKASTTFQDAVDRWVADHPRDYPARGSECQICGSPDGFKVGPGDGTRWACFSSRHAELTGDKHSGLGLRGSACFVGDALDIEAWTSKRTRKQVLQDDGYLSDGTRRQSPQPGPPDGREDVFYHTLDGDVPLHQLLPIAIHQLARGSGDHLFAHGETLVQVVGEAGRRDGNSPRLQRVQPAVLRAAMDIGVRWLHESKTRSGKTKVEERWCPSELVKAVLGQGAWEGVRRIVGVVVAPTVRPDLSVLCEPGYDPDTQLFYAPRTTYPSISSAPGEDEARKAVRRLLAPFDQFPLVSDADRAVLLSYLLTIAARSAIEGPVPMFCVRARMPGTGKTLLVDAATMAVTGSAPHKVLVPGGRSADAEAEWRKRITSCAMESIAAVTVDNVPDGAMLASPGLAAALTAETVSDRLLGANEMVRVPHRIVWSLTGNNISVAADLVRRCLALDLDAEVEDPHLRSDFRIRGLMEHVRARHPELCALALTVLLGFKVAGRPQHGQPLLGSFEQWDQLIRACVIWAIGIDPLETQSRLQVESPEVAAIQQLFTRWSRVFGARPVRAGDVVTAEPLRECLVELIGGTDLSARSVGRLLARYEGRVAGGLKLGSPGTKSGTRLWAVKEVRK